MRLLQPPRSHIINDTFNGVPIAVTYCPLCFSGVVFERPQIKGQVLDFATAGLYKRDLVMYDGQSFSLWQQFTGELLAGPLLGEVGRLHRIPADKAVGFQRGTIRGWSLMQGDAKNPQRFLPRLKPLG